MGKKELKREQRIQYQRKFKSVKKSSQKKQKKSAGRKVK
jgi:hypothetical protein